MPLIQYLLFWRFFLHPALQYFWHSETATVYPRLFPLDKIFFARPSAALLHLLLLNNFTFPTLPLVDNSRTIIACVSLKTGQMGKNGSRFGDVMEFERYIVTDIWLVSIEIHKTEIQGCTQPLSLPQMSTEY